MTPVSYYHSAINNARFNLDGDSHCTATLLNPNRRAASFTGFKAVLTGFPMDYSNISVFRPLINDKDVRFSRHVLVEAAGLAAGCCLAFMINE